MRILFRSVALSGVLCLMLTGCGEKQSEEGSKTGNTKPEAAQAESKPAAQEAAPAEQETKSQAQAGKQSKAGDAGTQSQGAAAPAGQEPKAAPASEVQKSAASAVPAPPPAVTPQSAPAATPVAETKRVRAKDVYILKGSPIGPVKFEHKLHQARAGNKCETCHHPSKPEKPATAAQQSCLDCHTKPLQAGMKTGVQGAFHNPLAKNGACIDCHKMQNAQGKNAPTKCVDCHKAERPG